MPYSKKMIEQERNRSGKLAYRYLQYTAKYRENFDVSTSLHRVYSSLYRNPETDRIPDREEELLQHLEEYRNYLERCSNANETSAYDTEEEYKWCQWLIDYLTGEEWKQSRQCTVGAIERVKRAK